MVFSFFAFLFIFLFCLLFVLFFFFFLFIFACLFGGRNGQVFSYFVDIFVCFVFFFFFFFSFFDLCVCFFLEGLRVRRGGPKGHLTWPQNLLFFALFCSCFFYPFASFALKRKNCFPPKKGHFCFFWSVSLCFSLAFFGLPLFHFLFLCLSLVLFFLPSFSSFFFAFFWFVDFVSFFIFLLCFCFMQRTTSKYYFTKFFFPIKPFSFGGLLVFFSHLKAFLSLFFPDFKLCFLFNLNVFKFQKRQVKNTIFGQEGGCNKMFCF